MSAADIILAPLSRERLVRDARSLCARRVAWVHQGRNPDADGLDCLGFLVWLMRQQGREPVGDRTDYPLTPDGLELRGKLALNATEVEKSERAECDIALIKFPGDEVARHLGMLVTGRYEQMLIHACNGRSVRRVLEEPYRRWLPYTVACFRFPALSA